MKSDIPHLTPPEERELQVNLDAFIQLCRQSNVLNAHVQFEKNEWETGHRKGHNGKLGVIFSTMEAAREAEKGLYMSQPFLDFAKAVLVYLQDSRPVVSQSTRIYALRCLEMSLRKWGKGARPTAVNVEVLDAAVELARESVSAGVADRVAGQLNLIADTMNTKGLIALRRPWRHGLKKTCESASWRVNSERKEGRHGQ